MTAAATLASQQTPFAQPLAGSWDLATRAEANACSPSGDRGPDDPAPGGPCWRATATRDAFPTCDPSPSIRCVGELLAVRFGCDESLRNTISRHSRCALARRAGTFSRVERGHDQGAGRAEAYAQEARAGGAGRRGNARARPRRRRARPGCRPISRPRRATSRRPTEPATLRPRRVSNPRGHHAASVDRRLEPSRRDRTL